MFLLKAVPILALALGAALAVPTAATPPGQNGKIVWQREPSGEEGFPHLFVANPDGSEAQRVFAGARNRGEIEGTFSPTDPDVMFFTRFKPRPFGEDLYRGNLATGDVSPFKTTKNAEFAATVSPDGTKIAYMSITYQAEFDEEPVVRVRVANIDGSGDRAITPRRDGAVDPDWSPDGRQIVYMQGRVVGEEGQERLVVINADGSGRRAITKWGGPNERNPKWMPDGETIVFERFKEGRKLSDIATVDVSEGTEQKVLATKYWETNPIPSPDGTRILFTSNRDRPGHENRLGRGFELYAMAVDGSDIERLTDNRTPDLFPDWQRLP